MIQDFFHVALDINYKIVFAERGGLVLESVYDVKYFDFLVIGSFFFTGSPKAVSATNIVVFTPLDDVFRVVFTSAVIEKPF
jgi:hypothetical protein